MSEVLLSHEESIAGVVAGGHVQGHICWRRWYSEEGTSEGFALIVLHHMQFSLCLSDFCDLSELEKPEIRP